MVRKSRFAFFYNCNEMCDDLIVLYFKKIQTGLFVDIVMFVRVEGDQGVNIALLIKGTVFLYTSDQPRAGWKLRRDVAKEPQHQQGQLHHRCPEWVDKTAVLCIWDIYFWLDKAGRDNVGGSNRAVFSFRVVQSPGASGYTRMRMIDITSKSPRDMTCLINWNRLHTLQSARLYEVTVHW